jgi:hypothetical protein
MSKPREPPKVGEVLVTPNTRLLCVGKTLRGCKLVNLDASTEVSDFSIMSAEGEVFNFEKSLLGERRRRS